MHTCFYRPGMPEGEQNLKFREITKYKKSLEVRHIMTCPFFPFHVKWLVCLLKLLLPKNLFILSGILSWWFPKKLLSIVPCHDEIK